MSDFMWKIYGQPLGVTKEEYYGLRPIPAFVPPPLPQIPPPPPLAGASPAGAGGAGAPAAPDPYNVDLSTSDLSIGQALGPTGSAPGAVDPSARSNWFRQYFGDPAVTAVSALAGIPAGFNKYGILPGELGLADNPLKAHREQQFAKLDNFIKDYYSPERKRQDAADEARSKAQDAASTATGINKVTEGFGQGVSNLFSDIGNRPLKKVPDILASSLPAVVGGAASGVLRASAATRAFIAPILEGLSGAGDVANAAQDLLSKMSVAEREKIAGYKELRERLGTDEAAAASMASNLSEGLAQAAGLTAGGLTKLFGKFDVDTMLVEAARGRFAKEAAKEVAKINPLARVGGAVVGNTVEEGAIGATGSVADTRVKQQAGLPVDYLRAGSVAAGTGAASGAVAGGLISTGVAIADRRANPLVTPSPATDLPAGTTSATPSGLDEFGPAIRPTPNRVNPVPPSPIPADPLQQFTNNPLIDPNPSGPVQGPDIGPVQGPDIGPTQGPDIGRTQGPDIGPGQGPPAAAGLFTQPPGPDPGDQGALFEGQPPAVEPVPPAAPAEPAYDRYGRIIGSVDPRQPRLPGIASLPTAPRAPTRARSFMPRVAAPPAEVGGYNPPERGGFIPPAPPANAGASPVTPTAVVSGAPSPSLPPAGGAATSVESAPAPIPTPAPAAPTPAPAAPTPSPATDGARQRAKLAAEAKQVEVTKVQVQLGQLDPKRNALLYSSTLARLTKLEQERDALIEASAGTTPLTAKGGAGPKKSPGASPNPAPPSNANLGTGVGGASAVPFGGTGAPARPAVANGTVPPAVQPAPVVTSQAPGNTAAPAGPAGGTSPKLTLPFDKTTALPPKAVEAANRGDLQGTIDEMIAAQPDNPAAQFVQAFRRLLTNVALKSTQRIVTTKRGGSVLAQYGFRVDPTGRVYDRTIYLHKNGRVTKSFAHEVAHAVTLERVNEATPVLEQLIPSLRGKEIVDAYNSLTFASDLDITTAIAEAQKINTPQAKWAAAVLRLEQARRELERVDPNEYGATNVIEFVAEWFSNPNIWEKTVRNADAAPLSNLSKVRAAVRKAADAILALLDLSPRQAAQFTEIHDAAMALLSQTADTSATTVELSDSNQGIQIFDDKTKAEPKEPSRNEIGKDTLPDEVRGYRDADFNFYAKKVGPDLYEVVESNAGDLTLVEVNKTKRKMSGEEMQARYNAGGFTPQPQTARNLEQIKNEAVVRTDPGSLARTDGKKFDVLKGARGLDLPGWNLLKDVFRSTLQSQGDSKEILTRIGDAYTRIAKANGIEIPFFARVADMYDTESSAGPQLQNLMTKNFIKPLMTELRKLGNLQDVLPEFERVADLRHRGERAATHLAEAGAAEAKFRAEQKLKEIPDWEKYKPALEALYRLNRYALDTRFNSGLLSQKEWSDITTAYQFYVPYKQDIEKRPELRGKKGAGFTEQRSQNAYADAESIFYNSIAAARFSIDLASRNRINSALAMSAMLVPDPGIVVKPLPKEAIETTGGGLDGLPVTTQKTDTLIAYINGKPFTMTFDSPDVLKQLRPFYAEAGPSDAILAVPGFFTRIIARSLTSANPFYGLAVGLPRDALTAVINLPKEVSYTSLGVAALTSWIDVISAALGKPNQSYQNYMSFGGSVDIDTELKAKKTGIDMSKILTIGESIAGTPAQRWDAAKSLASDLGTVGSFFNNVLENLVRYTAYQAAVKDGLPLRQAAAVAKKIGPAFDRKGATPWANNLYPFFGAALKGMRASTRALTNGNRVKYAMGGAMILAYLLAQSDDEDEELGVDGRPIIYSIDSNKRDSKILIKDKDENGKTIFRQVPLPQEVVAAWTLGRLAAEVGAGRTTLHEATARLASGIAEGWWPIGGGRESPVDTPEAFLVRSLLPGIVDPLYNLDKNKNDFGSQIYKNPDYFKKGELPHDIKWEGEKGYGRWLTDALWENFQYSQQSTVSGYLLDQYAGAGLLNDYNEVYKGLSGEPSKDPLRRRLVAEPSARVIVGDFKKITETLDQKLETLKRTGASEPRDLAVIELQQQFKQAKQMKQNTDEERAARELAITGLMGLYYRKVEPAR